MNTESMVCTSTQPVLDAELLLQLSLCLVLLPSASEVCLFRVKSFNPHFQTPLVLFVSRAEEETYGGTNIGQTSVRS